MKSRIGIIGGGQLGKMLGIEAKKLGFTVSVLDPTPDSPAGQVVDKQIVADFHDAEAIQKLAKSSDYLTYELEHINSDTLRLLESKGKSVNPASKTLEIIKDKYRQKMYLKSLGCPTAKFIEVTNDESFLEGFSYPFLLKTRLGGYDGKGNAVIRDKKDLKNAIKIFGNKKLYVEEFVFFSKEIAVIVVKAIDGAISMYPVVETIHKNNICHTVIAPARVSESVLKKAQRLASRIVAGLDGAGVYAIEMFVVGDRVLVNEIAPRVHNSGHLTIEACATNQFEQHIRAICGLPIGSTEMIVPVAVMVNILGDSNRKVNLGGLDKALAIDKVSVYIYGKSDVREGRKMGHITAIADEVNIAFKNALKARKYLKFIT